MSSMDLPFEVRVEVTKKGNQNYTTRRGWVQEKIVKIVHIWKRTPEQACNAARKYGRPLSARKMQVDELYANIEKLPLDNPPDVYDHYINPMGIDDMLWLNRGRRKYQPKTDSDD